MAYHEIFNEKLVEFLKELANSFPNIDEFKKLKSGATVLMSVDPKKPRDVFNKYVANKYRSFILSKNEDFFMTHKYEIYNDSDYWENFIMLIKNVWIGLNDSNKDAIWKYFNVLILLSDKCVQ